MRLILHTGAYWLLLDLRAAIPSWNPLRHTEFATIRLRLLKVAGRVIESVTRIRIAPASCCPEAETFILNVRLALRSRDIVKRHGGGTASRHCSNCRHRKQSQGGAFHGTSPKVRPELPQLIAATINLPIKIVAKASV
jgi:Transposase DDE domain group 1